MGVTDKLLFVLPLNTGVDIPLEGVIREVPTAGLEPATTRLKGVRSTD